MSELRLESQTGLDQWTGVGVKRVQDSLENLKQSPAITFGIPAQLSTYDGKGLEVGECTIFKNPAFQNVCREKSGLLLQGDREAFDKLLKAVCCRSPCAAITTSSMNATYNALQGEYPFFFFLFFR